MAAKCEICGKGPATGNNVSHAHRGLRLSKTASQRKLRHAVAAYAQVRQRPPKGTS